MGPCGIAPVWPQLFRALVAQNGATGVAPIMAEYIFEPIEANSSAPGGACTLRSFDDIGAYILNGVDLPRRLSGHWHAVRQDLGNAS